MLRLSLALVIFVVLYATPSFGVEIVHKEIDSISGVQLFVVPQKYDGKVDKYITELKNAGVNTIFLRVFHNSSDRVHFNGVNSCGNGGVYFETGNACIVSNITADFVQAAHKQGLKVFGWMATRSLSFLKTDDNMSLSFTPDGVARGYGANIMLPVVRAKILGLFQDLADTGVDGILVQDDFIMKYTEGADAEACKKFSIDTGVTCSEEEFFKDVLVRGDRKIFTQMTHSYKLWTEWKALQLREFLYEIMDSVRTVNPSLQWAVNIYYETPVYPDKGLSWYSQDMEGYWDVGVDYLAVMLYQEQIQQEMNLNFDHFTAFATSIAKASLLTVPDKNPNRVLFKLQVKNFDKNSTSIPSMEVGVLCYRIKKVGSKSFVQLPVYSAGDVTSACNN